MDLSRLKAPADWMRVIVRTVGATPPSARLLPVEHVPPIEDTAVKATYRFTDSARAELEKLLEQAESLTGIQIIVVIRSDDITQIADAADPPQILDADYAGTALPSIGVREQLWWFDPDTMISMPSIAQMPTLEPAGGTPTFYASGNGIEGGIFHAWFQIDFFSD
jgi:hypothetical protein